MVWNGHCLLFVEAERSLKFSPKPGTFFSLALGCETEIG